MGRTVKIKNQKARYAREKRFQKKENKRYSFNDIAKDIENRICHCCRKQAKNLWGVNDAVGDVVWVCDTCYKEMIDCMEW